MVVLRRLVGTLPVVLWIATFPRSVTPQVITPIKTTKSGRFFTDGPGGRKAGGLTASGPQLSSLDDLHPQGVHFGGKPFFPALATPSGLHQIFPDSKSLFPGSSSSYFNPNHLKGFTKNPPMLPLSSLSPIRPPHQPLFAAPEKKLSDIPSDLFENNRLKRQYADPTGPSAKLSRPFPPKAILKPSHASTGRSHIPTTHGGVVIGSVPSRAVPANSLPRDLPSWTFSAGSRRLSGAIGHFEASKHRNYGYDSPAVFKKINWWDDIDEEFHWPYPPTKFSKRKPKPDWNKTNKQAPLNSNSPRHPAVDFDL